MRKIALFILIFCSLLTKAQFLDQLNFIGTFTPGETDSILRANNIPTVLFSPLYTVNLYTVLYNTVNWDSVPTRASGILAVPIGPPCKPPMVSYQHSEITQVNYAPSNFRNEWFISMIAASAGYVAVCPDYLGLGIAGNGVHPFLHAQSEATAVIDMVRAARQATDSLGVPVNDQLVLAGYSEGGHATLAAHRMIQEQMGSTMHVTASAPLSGPYDLSGTMADVLTSDSVFPAPFYLPYLLFGYNTVYHLFAHDSNMLVYPYDSTLPPLFNGQHSTFTIDDKMPSVPSYILQPVQLDSMIDDSTGNFFRVRLQQNDVYNWNPSSPVRLIFCSGDETVPPQNSEIAYANFVMNGSTNVDTAVAGTQTHDGCSEFATIVAYNWLLTFIYQPVTDSFTINNSTSVDTPNGSITVYPSLGEAPYSFLWSNGDTSATIEGLTNGTYTVTITDKNLCTAIDSSTVLLVAAGIDQQLLTHVSIYPNPSKGMVYIRNTDASDDIKWIEAYDMDGRLAETHTTREGSTIQLYFDASAQGIYTLKLRSASGKELRTKIAVFQ